MMLCNNSGSHSVAALLCLTACTCAVVVNMPRERLLTHWMTHGLWQLLMLLLKPSIMLIPVTGMNTVGHILYATYCKVLTRHNLPPNLDVLLNIQPIEYCRCIALSRAPYPVTIMSFYQHPAVFTHTYICFNTGSMLCCVCHHYRT